MHGGEGTTTQWPVLAAAGSSPPPSVFSAGSWARAGAQRVVSVAFVFIVWLEIVYAIYTYVYIKGAVLSQSPQPLMSWRRSLAPAIKEHISRPGINQTFTIPF